MLCLIDDVLLFGKNQRTSYQLFAKTLIKVESKGHHVYIDNYYLTPNLFLDLHEKGFRACGTVSLNRTGMSKVWPKKIKRTKEDTTIKMLPLLKKGEVRTKN